MATLEIWIQTLQISSDKYEPTGGDEGNGQDLKANEGATVTAASPIHLLTATTQPLTIEVADDGAKGNRLALILTPLPVETPWEEDREP